MKRKKSVEVMEVKKQATGLRSAARLGWMTPEAALEKLANAKKSGKPVGDEIVAWLKRRQAAS